MRAVVPHVVFLIMASLLVAAANAEVADAEAALTDTPVQIFAQSALAVGRDGQPIPPVVLDPATWDDFTELPFDLGDGRELILRTNLPPERRGDAAQVAETVSRCYAFLEGETGRRIAGGVLLYILAFETKPLSYSFRVELNSRSRWSQIRLALLEGQETLTGMDASSHLREMLLGTLPHELTHQLIDAVPTVLHDRDGQPSHHTRWFTEGICEALAVQFASRENPAHARRLLADRRVSTVLDGAAVRRDLLTWSQDDPWPRDVESDLYGGAMLLAMAWWQFVPLDGLLADLVRTGGKHDGPALLHRLESGTGLSVEVLLDNAARLGRLLLAPDHTRRRDGNRENPPSL